MVRGAYLRDALVPLLDQYLHPGLDEKTYRRYIAMKERYRVGTMNPGDSRPPAAPPDAP